MAKIKAAFFDVDGTLFSFKEHAEPESTREAVRKLRAAGIMPILATGRPTYQFDGLDLNPFETFITLNGQLCFSPAGVYRNVTISSEDVRIIVERSCAGLHPTLFMERERFYTSEHTDRVGAVEELVGIKFPTGEASWALGNDIYQFNIYQDPSRDQEILDCTSSVTITRWTDLFADVFPKGGGKASAVSETLEHLGITPEEAIAFGDGGNDISMFDLVGTAVAMGNASDEVKAAANVVTDDVDHDGIYNACVQLGLIDV
ncbi:MAG: Cof-type HAD-IIB family hydrolase [Atopobium sp.]|uniref:Cof-type HAD-IIB family hydrolase n=1 Tax=Atopobium sp. TaxID=1872650 RepID=UPI002A747AA1|nr:Cof-type HAD-IIB family hydrolase [Atopobium sp.]MDY2788828.1 Cof-type HAD-IIB family hydrolase [Atopobium sp.]MDY4523043.1 Cof-type HAD-IIB family hydrolase [Atopobium sp.]